MKQIFEEHLSSIESLLALFSPISLADMDHLKLMTRTDRKFIVPLALLPELLNDMPAYYQVLEVEQKRISAYKTLYFDTPDFRCYQDHHAGKSHRFKIRHRSYLSNNLAFFEVKLKNNKNKTIKTRIPDTSDDSFIINDSKEQFVAQATEAVIGELQSNIWVNYSRITLVNKANPERVTIDIGLEYSNDTAQKTYAEIAIIEIKQEKKGLSPMIDLLKKNHVRQSSISKYCLGIISLVEGIKFNRFKTQINNLQKILQLA